MVTRQRIAAVVFLSFLATAVYASGQVTQTEADAVAYYYYEWIVPAGKPPGFMPIQPVDLKWKRRALKDGRYQCLFGTGAPKQIVVLSFRNGPPDEMPIIDRLILTVKENPDDPDDPPDDPDDPPLVGLAKQVYDMAAAVGRPSEAARFSKVYDSVASAIAAGGIKSIEEAHREVTRQNRALGPIKKEWKPTFDLVIRALKQYGQTLDGARETLAAIAQGFERAGK